MGKIALLTFLFALDWILSAVEFVFCSMGTDSVDFRKGPYSNV